MNENTAEMIVIVGAAIGIVIWFFGLLCLLKMKAMQNRLSKTSTIDAKDKDQAIKALLQDFAGKCRIIEKSDDGVKLQTLLSIISLRFESQLSGLSIHTEVDMSKMYRVFGTIMAVLVLVIEPLVVIGVPLLLWLVVVPSQVPAIRGQVFQVVQIIHVLWPPFLVYFLTKIFRRSIITTLDNIHILAEATS